MQISDYSPLVHKGAGCPMDIRLTRTEVKRRRVMPHMRELKQKESFV